MNIAVRSTAQCDYYFCCTLADENKILLPASISFQDLLYFLQGSLDQLKFVIISKHERTFDFTALKSTHFTIENDFIFLNFSVRNSLKAEHAAQTLQSFEEIRDFLNNILKK